MEARDLGTAFVTLCSAMDELGAEQINQFLARFALLMTSGSEELKPVLRAIDQAADRVG